MLPDAPIVGHLLSLHFSCFLFCPSPPILYPHVLGAKPTFGDSLRRSPRWSSGLTLECYHLQGDISDQDQMWCEKNVGRYQVVGSIAGFDYCETPRDACLLRGRIIIRTKCKVVSEHREIPGFWVQRGFRLLWPPTSVTLYMTGDCINQDLRWCVKIGVHMGFWVHRGF